MAPVPATEDYYLILEVNQDATPEIIAKSYKRLALKLHPDRNMIADTTAAFQRLGRAYETLKDESQRRAYNLIYPSIKQNCSPVYPSCSAFDNSSSAKRPRYEEVGEATQIAALQRFIAERREKWYPKKFVLDSTISEMQKNIRCIEREIVSLKSFLAAEAAKEAQKNSWATWLLSPLYGKNEDGEQEMLRKDRVRQEKTIEKDMKERRRETRRAELNEQEALRKVGQKLVDDAELADYKKIEALVAKFRARELREKLEKDNEERKRQTEIRRQETERQRKEWERQDRSRKEEQAKREREAAEAVHKQAQRMEERLRNFRRQNGDIRYARTANTSTSSNCEHNHWWPKVQGHTLCPQCSESWSYLLQCPGCKIQRCPRCQAEARPRRQTWMGREDLPRARRPSPVRYDYWDFE